MGDAKGVLSQADFEAINAGLGKAIASVPTSKVMDVYNAMAGVVGSSPVPNYLYSQVNPNDAQAACNALLEFKDVVKDSWTAMRMPCEAPNEYLCDQGTHKNCISGG